MNLYLRARAGYSLKADGVFLGNFSGDVKLERLSSPAMIELLPHFGGDEVCFFACEQLKSSENVRIYKLKDGFFADVIFNEREKRFFKVLYQKRFGNALVTVYRDGETRVVAETENSAEVCVFPAGTERFDAVRKENVIFVFSVGSPSFVCAFSVERGVKKIMENYFDKIEINSVLRTKTSLFDLENTVCETEWGCRGGEMKPEKTVFTKAQFDGRIKSDFFTERIFFERILNGLSTEELLTENMKKKQKYLRDYLGNFVSILPCYCGERGVCLAYPGRDFYAVRTFSVEFENGLIDNLKEV